MSIISRDIGVSILAGIWIFLLSNLNNINVISSTQWLVLFIGLFSSLSMIMRYHYFNN